MLGVGERGDDRERQREQECRPDRSADTATHLTDERVDPGAEDVPDEQAREACLREIARFREPAAGSLVGAGGASSTRLDRAMYLAAAMTGLRQGELLALRWKDVDWIAARIRVRRNYVRGEFGTPKARRSTRSVPMADEVAGALERL